MSLFVFVIMILYVFFLFKKWKLFNILLVVLKWVFGNVEWFNGFFGWDVIKIFLVIVLCLYR